MSGHAEELVDKERVALYVVATPIGNLGDITLRALDTLRAVNLVYAEDTRNSVTLLAHHGIQATLKPLHEHNEARAAQDVLHALQTGLSVALISDAGTPAISDPGARVVAEVRQAGYRVVPIPGPNAAIAALSVSGAEGPFLFIGFLPPKAGARRKALEAWRDLTHTLVFYEAPHRVLECVDDLLAVLGPARTLTIARELTKLFETIHTCRLDEAAAWFAADANRLRGEFVLIVSGAPVEQDAVLAEGERVLKLLLDELPLNSAARMAATITGARKNELYERGLAFKT
ncbi:MAG TPA: 16S rRNA (cytidine(1402)-2'-O)-methyltransferase [Burkholderiales bacterium]